MPEDLVKLKKEQRKMYNPKGLLDVTKQWSGEITFEYKPKYGRIKTDKEGRIIKRGINIKELPDALYNIFKKK